MSAIRLRFLGTLGLVALAEAVFAGEPSKPHWLPGNTTATAITATPVQPAGLPVVLQVILTNQTGKPAHIWTPLIPYPQFLYVPAVITNAEGKTQREYLFNFPGWGGGSGTSKPLAAGQSISVPAALPPLPAGRYRIQVNESKPARVTIKNDPALARQQADALVRSALAGDIFSGAVVGHFPVKEISAALIKALDSDDPRRVSKAAGLLGSSGHLSKALVPDILRLMRDELDRVQSGEASDAPLAHLMPQIGTDEALKDYVEALHSAKPYWTNVIQLGRFRQPAAAEELRRFLKSSELPIRVAAARALAPRHDPAALPVLLEVASGNSTWRPYALENLKYYPGNANALRVAKEALNSPDRSLRFTAQQVLNQVQANKAAKQSHLEYEQWMSGWAGPAQLALQPAVATDLGLSADQSRTIKSILLRHQAMMNRDQANPWSPEEKQKQFVQLRNTVNLALTPAQQHRLWQINLQKMWPRSLGFPEVQDHLHLSAAQQQAIRKIEQQEREESTALYRAAEEHPVDNLADKAAALTRQARKRMFDVLTKQQKQAWQALVGKPWVEPRAS